MSNALLVTKQLKTVGSFRTLLLGKIPAERANGADRSSPSAASKEVSHATVFQHSPIRRSKPDTTPWLNVETACAPARPAKARTSKLYRIRPSWT